LVTCTRLPFAGSPKICPFAAIVFHMNGISTERRSSAVARQNRVSAALTSPGFPFLK
jgi:hypothetical protein